jgi:hypothetical protein
MHAQKAVLVQLMVPDYARSIPTAKPKAGSAKAAAKTKSVKAAAKPKPTVFKATKPVKKTASKKKR